MSQASDRLRFQYKVVNLGTFFAGSRLTEALAHLGADGWEVVGIYDKGSNWLRDMEKGFLLCKRPVLPGEGPDGPWATTLSSAGANNLTQVHSAGHHVTVKPEFGPGVRVRLKSGELTGTIESFDPEDPAFCLVCDDATGEVRRYWRAALEHAD